MDMNTSDASTVVLDHIRNVISEVSGVDPADIKAEVSLLELGLDSLMFVRIGRIVEKAYGVNIPMKRFYDELYIVEALCRHLETAGTCRPEAETDGLPAVQAPVASTPVAAAAVLPDVTMAAAGDSTVDEVMLAHLALMRRYLASDGATPAPGGSRPVQPDDDEQTRLDAAEMRRRFSGVELEPYELTAQQQEFINALATRVSATCAGSKQRADEWRGHLADWKYLLQLKRPLKELRFPLVCERAAGAHVWDVDGNRYIDIAMGMGVHFWGHAPAFVENAIIGQMKQSSALGLQSTLAGEVAAKICRLTGHDRVALFVTGSDSVMLALRLVRAARARRLVVLFGGSYHGICSDILGAQGENGTVSMSPGIPRSFVDDILVLDYGSDEALAIIESRADELAGVLVEPVQSRRPSLQPQRFLRHLRRITAAHGVPLVFDEMVNGFRIAPGGAQEWFGVQADLATYGKIVGGGLPFSVIGGRADLMRWVDGGPWHYGDNSFPLADTIATGGTHNRHPLALAAANAVLDHIQREADRLYPALQKRMRSMADRLNVYFEREAIPIQLTYFGTQFRFDCNAFALEMELFFYLMLERGIFTWELHGCCLSTAHTDEDCDAIIVAVKDSVRALRAGGFTFRADARQRFYHPMSSVQRRIYALTQREGAEKPYHLSGLWRLTGRIDADRLEDCFHQVICRHESLRTAFVVVDGEFYQHVVPEPRFFLERIEAAGADPQALLERFIRPFDIESPPILRVGLAGEADGCFLLLLDAHHLAVDGLSMNIVADEVLRLYNGEALPAVRRQARHVQQALEVYEQGEQAREDKEFWMETLRGELPQLALPLDYPRPVRLDFQGERILLRVGSGQTERLRRHARAARSSTLTLLLAAFTVWLYRLTRQQDILIGIPSAGRPGSDNDTAVGMFANTIVFRGAVDSAATFATLLSEVRDGLFAVQEHADYPFASLLEQLGIRPSPDRNPLFDVMFSYEHAGQREIRTHDFTGRTLEQFEGAGMFDLSFDIIETDGELLVNCAYAKNLFEAASVQRWLGDFEWILDKILGGTDVGIAELAAARPEEATLIRQWNEQACRHPLTLTTIVQEWAAQVERTPEATALREGDRIWTYAELDQVTTTWAAALEADEGVKQGDNILVSLDASAALIMGTLAVMKAGAVYVPATCDTPAERVGVMARRAGSRLCITNRTDLGSVVHCVSLDPDSPARKRQKKKNAVKPDDSAYIIFTSGSTGEPKGVEISHAGACNIVNWRCRTYRLGDRDVTLQMPSCAFDASITDIFCTLLSGAELVMLSTADKRTLPVLADALVRSRATNVVLTPSLYRLYLEQIPEAFKHLRLVALIGEAVTLELARTHFQKLPAVELWNEYGPTENSVISTCCRLEPDVRQITIGPPVDHVGAHIHDDDGVMCPVGVWGELWLTGVGLAKGYVGLEVQTRERFRDLPGTTGCRAYRTGDIARWLPGGEVDFLGRRDGQVKLNGYRIERQEIEDVLKKVPGIRGAVVDVVQEPGRLPYLAAWVVCPDGIPPDWSERLRVVLPAPMVPKAIVNVAAIPLTASGKVNRSALPKPSGSVEQAVQAAVPEGPLNDAQRVLLDACRTLLQRPSLGIGDHYFESGGDSIQGILLVSRLHELGWTLDLNEVFRHPILHDLAAVMTPGRAGGASLEKAADTVQSEEKSPAGFADKGWTPDRYRRFLSRCGIDEKQVQDLWPLTPMQTGLLFQARLAPDDDAYFEQVHFRLDGVNADLLEKSFRCLVRRHAALRASFPPAERGDSVQVIHRAPELPVMRLDLSGQGPEKQATALDALIRQDRGQRFSVTQAPLMRVTLADLGNGHCHVIWSHHHLLMDGWCVGILYENLMQFYEALLAGRPVPVDAAPDLVPYFDWLSRQSADSAKTFWRERLSGFDGMSRLPPWGVRGGAARYDEGSKVFHMDRVQTERVRAWAAAHAATLSSVLRLAWGVLLARFADREDVVFGSIVSGRPPEVSGMDKAVGLLINTVPVRFRLTGTVTAVEGLKALRDQANEARAHEFLPLAEIQAACGFPELFDHLLVFENYPMEETLRSGHAGGSGGRPALRNVVSRERTHYPLNVVVSPCDGLEINVMYDRQSYPDRQVDHLAEHFMLVLARLVDNPDEPLAKLDLLADAERTWLVKEWNATAAAYDKSATVSGLFDRQVASTPDAVAVISHGLSLTYAQLDAEATRVAAGLQADSRFVPGGRIALWMPKSHEMVIAMLGVLKAGAAYVPLDPLYPAERLRFILEDCGAPFVLTGAGMPALDSPVPLLEMKSLEGSAVATAASTAPRPDDCAYVIYTSGSTGKPKGCMVSHRNVVRLMANDRHDFDFSSRDVWVAAHSFCFDFSVWELYGALLYGGRLVIPEHGQVRDTNAFYDLLAREGVTILNQTPPAFYRLAEVACRRGVKALAALRTVIFGGDRLAPELLQDWVAQVPLDRVALINMYGITETTVHVTYHALTMDDIAHGEGRSRIGRPIPETEVWIRDRLGNLQPPGVAGEMIIGGSGVCLGYLNRPELTAERFVQHPLRPDERVYRSGDLGRLDNSGGLEYLGRNDFQVQVRGFRVEVGEIENCLLKHEAVKKAVVLPFEDDGSTGLVAYLEGDRDEAPANWRRYLSKRLPEYMIPAHIMWVDEMPLTGNGKLDRNALPSPDANGLMDARDASGAPPQTAMEAALASVWSDVLGVPDVCRTDHFFDRGGQSLKAVKVVALIEERIGCSLSLADVFAHPVLADMAARLAPAPGDLEMDADLEALLDMVPDDELSAALDALQETERET